MKKGIALVLSALMLTTALAGCGKTTPPTPPATSPIAGFDTSKNVTVISREDGSGTRGAFVELFEILEKDPDGKKVDMTVETADITQSTGVMLTSVAGNPYAIGYVSLGSLNDTVRALKIDGAEATVDNIKSGNYKISRPFNIATNGTMGEATQDFVNFIMSQEGQKVVEAAGYISEGNTGAFESSLAEGKVTVTGSSSVTPVMEKLKEAYEAINSKVTIEVSQSDSTTGMNSVIDGICDIGMASRGLKDSELEKGIIGLAIAIDGIAVVVNNENSTEGLTAAQVKNIFVGTALTWADAGK